MVASPSYPPNYPPVAIRKINYTSLADCTPAVISYIHANYNNKLIFLYLKTRRCKYYTLNTMLKVHKIIIMDKNIIKSVKI